MGFASFQFALCNLHFAVADSHLHFCICTFRFALWRGFAFASKKDEPFGVGPSLQLHFARTQFVFIKF